MIERLSLCNEVLAPWSFVEQCAYASRLGYRGLEVAPFTLVDDPLTVTDAQAAQWARIAADHGLAVSGLHWLLVAPAGLSISSPDAAVRTRTLAVMHRLVELCAQMGGSYLVHGSPAQRNPVPGQRREDALALASEAWLSAGERASALGLVYCIEPLGRAQTEVVNTVDEALAIVRAAALPGLKTMLDTSSAGATEAEPLPELVDRVWQSGLLAHVQLNDRNRRGPGQGEDRFAPILAALARQGYAGWLAMEPFDYQPDGAGCAAHSIGYVRGLLEALPMR
ncbi:MAG TPA: sugar phosphate isomerase/epimerase family protein [Caldimonas sp.]|jgi:sugar phosphate isomerase/epimerase|nr:sugar phosphate isomerase/epimerase family protein [Caldimonas sp.]HEX2542411.1 sugar phosphate isomerase/epimerase family protein [Caldimonas sp.]